MDTPETKYATVDGASVAYQIVGEGPIDLVYHGGFSHADVRWTIAHEAAFLRRLASFSRVILFDRRGSGASDRDTSGAMPSWEQWAEDLLCVLNAIGSTRVALFAESDSSPLALMFAAANPDRVSALVIGNGSARTLLDDDYPDGASIDAIEAEISIAKDHWGTIEAAKNAYPSLAHDDEAMRAMATYMRTASTPGVASAHLRDVMTTIDARPALPKITVPALLLRNERSLRSGLGDGVKRSQYLVDHLPNARLIEFPGTDVRIGPVHTERVAQEVAQFLTGQNAPSDLGRFLTTVLFTDIVSSTERAIELGDNEWTDLLDAHDRSVRHHLGRYRGREIKTTGDGFLACFETPSEAISCAIDIAASARKLGLDIRAGLHSGECEWRGEDIAGVAVHVAARIDALAAPGEILVSRTVTDLVNGSSMVFTPRGQHVLKGIPGRWELFAALSS